MRMVNKSIRIIDYENNQIIPRETPAAFDNYVTELITYIGENDAVRDYKTRSNFDGVIGSVKSIVQNQTDAENVRKAMDGLANRLLLKDTEAQEKISRLGVNVQKGSLIQTLLYNDINNCHVYLLAKVDHTEWVDDLDFSFKTGFSKDKKAIWKTCLIDLPDINADEFYAKIYVNTQAKYWTDGFLEFDEMVRDEVNTERAFKAVDATINRHFQSQPPNGDKTEIRNGFIVYFRNREADHIDYNDMVNEVVGNYTPVDVPAEIIQALKTKLLELPEKLPDSKKFDRQFNAVNKVINARIKKTYPISDGIELRVNKGIEDLQNTIQAVEEADGKRYLKIAIDNEKTFQSFNFKK